MVEPRFNQFRYSRTGSRRVEGAQLFHTKLCERVKSSSMPAMSYGKPLRNAVRHEMMQKAHRRLAIAILCKKSPQGGVGQESTGLPRPKRDN